MPSQRSIGDRSRPVVFKAEKPHFFKIIFEKNLNEKRLRIPKMFTRLYGHTLSESVVLKLPCGSLWRIGLEKCSGGEIWLRHGWSQLTESYSLKRGHMLVFKYQGDSKFSLVVFNDTTCEIDYPLFDDHRVKKAKERHGEFGAERCGEPEPKAKTNDAKGKGRSKSDILRCTKRLAASELKKPLAMAKGFTSDKPFFKAVMQPSYVLTSRMSIPSRFARTRLKHNKSCNASLEVSSGKSWAVKYSNGVYKTNQWNPTARFYGGWKEFARDNSLDIGDVCVFVLTENSDRLAFEVTIFKSSVQNANTSIMSRGYEGGEAGKDKQKGAAESEADFDSFSSSDDDWTLESMTGPRILPKKND